MQRSVVNLRSRAARDEALAGGKAAGLARLIRHGFSVPPGFVILLRGGAFPSPAEEQQIRQCYRRLGGRVAVRSSMAGEDSAKASYAGQLETILRVEGEDHVIEAVRNCCVSLVGPRVERYREGTGARGSIQETGPGARGGVIVQRMHEAAAAGVAFSADPITGKKHIVIEAAPGAAEGVVGGRVDPDRYVVSDTGEIASFQPVNPARPVLDSSQVQQLAKSVARIAEVTGGSRDVEWLWDGRQFVFLQARPITTLPRNHVYSNRLTSDMMPGLIRPLVWSTNAISMSKNVVGRILRELIGPSDFDYTTLIRSIHSRVYADMTAFGSLFERMGFPSNFLEIVSRDEKAEGRRPRVNATLVRNALRVLRFASRQRALVEKTNRFLLQHDSDLEAYRHSSWASEDPENLLKAFDGLMELHGTTQWSTILCALNMNIRNRILTAWVRKRAPGVIPSDLLRGLLGLKALEPNLLIEQIALLVRAHGNGLPELLAQGDDAAIRQTLSSSTEGGRVLEEVDRFICRYGFLSVNGTDYAEIPWAENPRLIWSAIGRSARAGGGRSRADTEAIRESASRRIRSALSVPERSLFGRLLASTITYIHLREKTSLFMSEDAFQMRRIALALGDRFVSSGGFGKREDIFFLEHEELRQLVRGDLQPAQVRSIVAARREEFESDVQLELEDILHGAEDHSGRTAGGPQGMYLQGLNGSSGVAEGYARIVRDPAEVADPLTRRDILVVPYSDVGWTLLFSGIGGIVAETGGQLSHTAIVAREYGLPAVVSVKNATRLIKNGQPVRIDADAGKVFLFPVKGDQR